MEIISVHVPKTAGSTFGNFLTTIYGVGPVYKDYEDVPLHPLSLRNASPEEWRRKATAEVRALDPSYRAIHGHFTIDKYDGAFPEARRIAWVRHPAAWLMSLYSFWQKVPRTTNPLLCRLQDEKLSLLEFAADPSVRDRISQLFLSGWEPGEFCFVGIQEHLQEDILDLVGMMNWPEIAPGFENRSPDPRYQDRLRENWADPALIARLVALNEKDMAFYDEACRLRAKRLARRARTTVYLDSQAA